MEFVSYTLFDLIGLMQGLIASKFVNEALLLGNILAPIVILFMFLSVYKIGMEVIVRKDYIAAGKDFAFLIAFVFFFTTTAPATVYFVNLTQYFLKKKVDFSIWTNDEVNPEVGGVKIHLREVPLADVPLAFMDSFAYQVSKTLLDTKDLSENMIKWKLKSFPNLLFDLALMDYVGKGKDSNERLDRLFTLGYCFKVWDIEGLSEEDRQYLKDTLSEKGGWIKAFIQPDRCDDMRREYAEVLKEDAYKYFADNKVYRRFYVQTADSWIKDSSAVPVEVQRGIARGILASRDVIEATKSTINYPHRYQDTVQKAVNNIYSNIQALFAKNITSLLFYENIMYKMQQVVLFLLVALFPLVIALSFLPVFGYNFKLFGVYMFAYFLTKMWIPLYLIAHKVLYNDMLSNVSIVISYVLPLFPSPAYADSAGLFTFLNTTLPKTTDFNIVILNGLAIGIPSTLGAISAFLVGRSLHASMQRAIQESALIGKMALLSGMNFFKGGYKALSGTERGLSQGQVKAESVKLSTSLAGGGSRITEFTREGEGLFKPTGDFIKAGDLKTGMSYKADQPKVQTYTPEDMNRILKLGVNNNLWR